MTVHNEILKRRPDLAPVMAAPWYMDRKGEVPEGKQPYFQIPIFNYFKVSSIDVLPVCMRFCRSHLDGSAPSCVAFNSTTPILVDVAQQ